MLALFFGIILDLLYILTVSGFTTLLIAICFLLYERKYFGAIYGQD